MCMAYEISYFSKEKISEREKTHPSILRKSFHVFQRGGLSLKGRVEVDSPRWMKVGGRSLSSNGN